MALTDMTVKQAKASEKLAKLSDGGGLQLWVFPDGAKRWRLAYRYDGKQQTLTLGVYPEVGLKDARDGRTKARELITAGIDPNQQKKREKLVSAHERTNTFRAIVEEVLDKKRREGKAEATLTQVRRLCGVASEMIGDRPIAEIEAPEILMLLRQIEARGTIYSAHRTLGRIGEVFRYAVATGRAKYDPTSALRGALTEHKEQHHAAIVQEKPFGALLRAIDGYQGAPDTIGAFKFLTLTFVRSGTLRYAEWSQIDWDEAVWNIPEGIMKGQRGRQKPHFVPLAPQTIALLRGLHTVTGRGKFLFPGRIGRPMSENTINAALRGMGYAKNVMSGHGFRASATSILTESNRWSRDAVEAQMAHEEPNAVRRAYARGEHWDERVMMMNWWADKVDELRRGGEVVPLRA